MKAGFTERSSLYERNNKTKIGPGQVVISRDSLVVIRMGNEVNSLLDNALSYPMSMKVDATKLR